jgi:SAM-dependent methyltransferase
MQEVKVRGADPFQEFKARQREMWSSFAPTATFTTPVAGQLVKFAGIRAGESVLDVGTGTGVVAVTAARTGARVSGLDLTPALLEHAVRNAALAGVDVTWKEGDAEDLPFPDASFDVVTSQFGHMFAPRPDVAIAEMRRVLKPGGRVVFATWPPDELVGMLFGLMARFGPPPPPGAAPPPQWGVEPVISERLSPHFEAPTFSRGDMFVPALSVTHFRDFMEHSIGPLTRIVDSLAAEPARLQTMRDELDAMSAPYFADNQVRQRYLFTRAQVKPS